MAQDSLPTNQMPRRITIFLSAPPGDGLRAAREHFHEYVKPILVAGALDWDVVEGRKEGEVRAGFAEKIRKIRRRNGEEPLLVSEKEGEEDLLKQRRLESGIKEWKGVQGDLIIGRHTWKEYIRGLHEGWLGPMDPPPPPPPSSSPSETSIETSPEPVPDAAEAPPTNSDTSRIDTIPSETPPSNPPSPQTPQTPSPEPAKPTPSPPYILPASYPTSPLCPSTPESLPPSLAIPLPHLLGFLHTPTRLYRFLTRRHLANTTGASVAALVLATNARPYTSSTAFASAVDPDPSADSTSPSMAAPAETGLIAEGKRHWEQEDVLAHEEAEWHKVAWKEDEPGAERERAWKENMVVDDRIGARMSVFELAAGETERAFLAEEERRGMDGGVGVWKWVRGAGEWVGLGGEEGKKGWEMGLEGGEDD